MTLPEKHYVYAVVDSVTKALVHLDLTRQLARAYITHLGHFAGPETLRVRRAKLTLFDT